MQNLNIVKVGGGVINEREPLNRFLRNFAAVRGNKILVHGGGKLATDLADVLGIPVKMVEGRRITDAEMLRVVVMVYGGLVNKTIVSKLQALDCNALGLTGADANIIPAHKRIVEDIDYGFVGDFDKIQTKPIIQFLESGLTPVLAPLTHDLQGNILNTNADTIASGLARDLSRKYSVHLFLCFDKKGVLSDSNDETSVIPVLTSELYRELKSNGGVDSGMIPKLDNGFAALSSGVEEVRLCHAEDLSAAVSSSGSRPGTKLQLS